MSAEKRAREYLNGQFNGEHDEEHVRTLAALLKDHGTWTHDCACAGCHVQVPGCWETPMCVPCATEDCEHEEGR